MTLVVEDGTGLATANCYTTLDAAQLYFEGSLYSADWDNETPDNKTTALIMATRVIDTSCIFKGYRKTTVQALEWPRIRARNPDFYGWQAFPRVGIPWIYYDENSIPKLLADATALNAIELIRKDRTIDPPTKGVKSFELPGPLRFDFDKLDRPVPLTDSVKQTLQKLVKGFRGSSGMRHVVRVQ
jgi:DnaT-like ssDNA binding protein